MPAGWALALALAALLVLMLPLAVFGSVFSSSGGTDPDLAAVRVTETDDDPAASDDDERDPDDRDATVRETVDGNTLRDGAYSVTGNTKIGDTTERPTKDGNTLRNGDNSITGNTRDADTTRAPARAAAPAAQGFAPAYVPAGGGDSVSGASASG